MPKKTTTAPRYVTEGRAQELVDEVVRKALREQARDLETHLRNIHKRLVSLEKKQVPRYQYACSACDKDVTTSHLSSETAEVCPLCESDNTLTKKLTRFATNTPKRTQPRQKTGEITEQFIKDARKELQQQKKDLENK